MALCRVEEFQRPVISLSQANGLTLPRKIQRSGRRPGKQLGSSTRRAHLIYLSVFQEKRAARSREDSNTVKVAAAGAGCQDIVARRRVE